MVTAILWRAWGGMEPVVDIIGGGLAGCEAAWQLARRGVGVRLYEMRPGVPTPAHTSGGLAELVCSNSLGSKLPDRATGLLLAELKRLGSLLAAAAEATSVPAGGALAVDRDAFSAGVTRALAAEPLIEIRREEFRQIPVNRPAIIAAGPLASDALAAALQQFTGEENLAFFDAIAPIVQLESVDMATAYRASRRDRGEREDGDYLNCPFTKEQYFAFVQALAAAETFALRGFEQEDKRFFEGCLAVEVLAKRDPLALRFGPMRGVGLDDPKTGRWPFAAVQLRQDNLAGSLYNLVGFQTNLKWPEQERIFRMIPGLEKAQFVRFGQMHRNTFVKSPAVLEATLECRQAPGLFLAGQIAGVEGYLGSVGTGLLAGMNAARAVHSLLPQAPPRETMLGALCHYLANAAPADFQPMKANFGILPPLDAPPRAKRDRYQAYATRALAALDNWLPQQQSQ